MTTSPKRSRSEILNIYEAYLLSKVSKVRILGEAQERDLINVFVELSVSGRHHYAESARLLEMVNGTMRLHTDPFEPGNFDNLLEPLQGGSTKYKVKLDELFQASTRAIITGTPGCGKTTLLKYLALQAHKAGRFVIWLELKTIDDLLFVGVQKAAVEHNNLLLQELWLRHIKTQMSLSEHEVNLFRECWRDKFKADELVILLDGFDEVQTKDLEIRLNKCVSEFTSAFSNNTLLISTRPYALGKLGNERLQEFEIEPLTQHQIEAFLTCYYPKDQTVSGLLKKLRKRPAQMEMLTVPLLLGMVLRFVKENRLSDEPLKLYEAIVTGLAHELDRSKSVSRQFNFPDKRLRLDFLKFLAFDLLMGDSLDDEDPEPRGVVFSYSLLKQKALDFLSQEHSSLDPRGLAEDILATALVREVGAETFAFTHLTLQEYLAACYLAAFHKINELEGLRVFCLAYHNPTVVEMEVLPMMLGASSKSNCLYEELEMLPESLTFANFRLRARGLGYGASLNEGRLAKIKERLVNLLFEYRVESKAYFELISKSFSASPHRYLNVLAEPLEQFLNQNQFDYTRMKTTDLLGRLGGEKARTLLELALKDKAEFVRRKAAYWLGELRDSQSVPALKTALTDKDLEVVKAAAGAIVNIGSKEGMLALLDLLKRGNTASRAIAIFWIGIAGREITLDLIEGILASQEPEIRLKALEALGYIGGERALSMLCNSNVCITTVTAVGQCGGEKAIRFLLNALEHPTSHVRCAAIDSLVRLDRTRFVDVFTQRLQDPDPFVRQHAASALGMAADSRAVPALLVAVDYASHLDIASSHRGIAVGAAAEALGHFREEEVVQSLLDLLQKHGGGDGTQDAAIALGRIGDKRAVEPVLRIFDDARNIAWAAAEALGLIGDKCATLRLIELLREGEGLDQMRAAEALGRIRDERAIVPLFEALQKQIGSEEAALALRNFDPSVIAEELPTALTHENPFVRRKAVTYIPYYCVDPRLVTKMTLLAESDPNDLVRITAQEANEAFTRKLEVLGYVTGKGETLPTDNESLEGVLAGEVMSIVASAGHFFREVLKYDEGVDGEIEFRNSKGRGTGQKIYLQLKSGDSHLYIRKRDGKEIFTLKKPRHAKYWLAQAHPVFLVIRQSNGKIRWMNVTKYLRLVGTRLTQIEFQGEPFTTENIQRARVETRGSRVTH
jgi:HEAT repeat protein